MNKLVKKLVCGTLITVMSITAMAGCGAQEETFDGTQILISNEEDSLNAGAANFFLRTSQAQMQEYLQTYGNAEGGVWESYSETLKTSTIDTIIGMLVMRSHARAYGIELSADEQSRIKEAAAAFVEDNGEDVMKTLGMTQEDVETVLALYTYQSKMYNPIIEDVDTEVTDEEAAQASIRYLKLTFVETDDEGNTNEVAADEKEARKAAVQEGLDQMLASEDVASMDLDALAEELHEDMFASAALSFSINNLDEDSTTIDRAVKDAVLENLEDGAVVEEVVEGEDAYYAVFVEDALDEEATEEQKESIVNERKYTAYNDQIEEWKVEANYQVDEDVWASMEVTDSHLYLYKEEEAAAEE